MTLVNLLGDLNLEVTQAALLVELGQKLEAGQTVVISDGNGSVTVDGPLTDVQLRALAVAVSGTVALDAATLAALETINAAVTGTVAVSNFPATQPVSGPLTDTQLRATPVTVVANAGTGTQSVSGTVVVSNHPANLTDTQLRASPVPVSVSGNVEVVNDVGNPLPVTGTLAVTGPVTDVQLRATPVPVSGPLTDVQLRASAVPVSITSTIEVEVKNDSGSALPTAVSNFPATQAVTGPLTDTQLRAAPMSVTDNAGSLTTDGSFDERYSGGKLSYATTVIAAGDTALLTPAAGKALRVVWVSAIPSPDNTGANRIRLKFGTGGAPFYETFALAHWEVFQGAVDQSLYLNAATAEPVSITVHYREIP